MRRFALFLALLGSPAMAQDWTPMTGDEIRAALSDRSLYYPRTDARQTFHASGRTLYSVGGNDSWGTWRVEGDAYCSQWPPSDLWACYELDTDGVSLRFIAPGPDITEATYAD